MKQRIQIIATAVGFVLVMILTVLGLNQVDEASSSEALNGTSKPSGLLVSQTPMQTIKIDSSPKRTVLEATEKVVVTPTPTLEPTATPTATPTPTPTPKPTKKPSVWKSLGTFRVTAYCSCKRCCGKWAYNRPVDKNGSQIVYTASGAVAKAGTTIAVDPSVIPMGTKVKINGHVYTAQDTGNHVTGNAVDIYFSNHSEARAFGLQRIEVFVYRS